MKIICGAGGVMRPGWVSLQQSDLDIRDRLAWARMFRPASLTAVLIEHLLEHLSESEARAAVRNFHRYLKRGGYVRCAVPDGYHPSPAYLDWVTPGSVGERWLQNFRLGDAPHKTLWNYRSLTELFCESGFAVILLEWFDAEGRFHRTEWDAGDGYIRRCAGCAWAQFLSLIVGAPYTSLIADCVRI